MTSYLGSERWKPSTLQDLVTLQRGFDITKAEQKEGEVPVISSSGFSSWHNEAMVEGPGIIIGRKGSLGTVHYSEIAYWPHDTTLWSKLLHGNNPRFVYYALKVLNLERFNVGGANPTLNRNHIHGLPIFLPSRSTQDEVARILTAYDEFIENNRKRIGLLEEAARLLYREWFVHFRFPGDEHVKVVNGLPEGWAPRTIKEMTDFLGRGISPSYDEEAEFLVVNQKCIRDRMLSMVPARKQKKEFAPAKALQFLDVLINSTGTGTLGRVAQCWFNPTGATFDSHVTVARANGSVDPYWFGYALLALENVFEGMGEGATNQKELAKSRIAAITVTTPSISLQKDFGSFAADSCRQIQTLAEQNEKLLAARDLLLPRLMSGEIAV